MKATIDLEKVYDQVIYNIFRKIERSHKKTKLLDIMKDESL